MSFAGIRDEKTRINLIAWLRTQGSGGFAIPASDPARQPGAAVAAPAADAAAAPADATAAPAAEGAAPADPAAAPAAAPAEEDPVAKLTKLKEMLDNELITQADYDAAKNKILGL